MWAFSSYASPYAERKYSFRMAAVVNLNRFRTKGENVYLKAYATFRKVLELGTPVLRV